MGAKKRDGSARKPGREKLTEVVASLSGPETDAVTRVRSIASALDLQKVVNIIDANESVMSAVQELLRRDPQRYTVGEAAERIGLPVEELIKLNLACGFAHPGPDAKVLTEEDIEIMQLFQISTQFFGEELALQNVRVIGSAMSRVADAFISTFAVTIGRQSSESEFTAEDMTQANETAIAMLPSAVKAMDVLLRRHMELKSRPEFTMGEEWEGVDAVDRAVGFCDLVGYTALSQQVSTQTLAAILNEFEATASDLIHGGRRNGRQAHRRRGDVRRTRRGGGRGRRTFAL